MSTTYPISAALSIYTPFILLQTAASVEVEAKDSTDEDKESKEEEEVVKEQLQMSIADVKSIMETMATAALQSFQVGTNQLVLRLL